MKKPRNLRPAPVVSKADAKVHGLSWATGLEATDHGFTRKQVKYIADYCRHANVPVRQALSVLRRVMAEYLVEREFDDFAATPAEVRDFSARAQKVASDLQSLIHPKDRSGRAIIRRMGSPSQFLVEDLSDLVTKFANAAADLQSDAAAPGRGGAREIEANRQRALAERLRNIFATRGWPTRTTETSLLSRLLPICLESVGEDVPSRPDRLFKVRKADPAS